MVQRPAWKAVRSRERPRFESVCLRCGRLSGPADRRRLESGWNTSDVFGGQHLSLPPIEVESMEHRARFENGADPMRVWGA